MSKAVRPTFLRAGLLTLCFDAGDLRYLKLGEREVIRRIYGALRDRHWDTVPATISHLESQISDSLFRITYTSTHRRKEIHFVWQAELVGEPDGSIRFTFDGEAKSSFLRNRIGLCVLHPIRECAGARCRAFYVDGTEKELAFPEIIAAEQPVKGLHDLAGLAHEIDPGVWARLGFAGDVFETEDQRNWIDASFKTYGTPLSQPFPVEITAGTRVRQEVRLDLLGAEKLGLPAGPVPTARYFERQSAAPVAVTLRTETRRLPALGLGFPSRSLLTHEEEVLRLADLKPAHIRVDVRLWEREWQDRFLRAESHAADLNAQVELALHVNETAGTGLKHLGEFLRDRRDSLCRLMVFQRGQKATTTEALHAVRRGVGGQLPGVPIGAGTDADLYQLNLQRPPPDADFICWSMNPQVHAFDNLSIAETPEAAAQQVASVRRYFPGKPLVVSPVSLRPRLNPNATGSEPPVTPGELPPAVDPRQLSLFGAAWTLAMLKALAESGADSVTFFETTGWRGVMETAAGSTLPEKFPSIAGTVFPLYHVLADAADFRGGDVVWTESGNPLRVVSLLLRAGARRRLMMANLSPSSCRVKLQNFDQIVLARILDESNRMAAMTSPEEFRESLTPFHGTGIELGSHAVVTLELASS